MEEEVSVQTKSNLAAVDVPNVHDSVSVQIKEIFEKNQLDDLNRFIAKRATLNKFTTFLMYGSYVFQSTGIFVTTLATGYHLPELT